MTKIKFVWKKKKLKLGATKIKIVKKKLKIGVRKIEVAKKN